jgi:ABC-2 type transport system ATP-binding protein
MQPAIEVQNLTKTYKGGVSAVRGVDLRIERGEIYGLLGPNGAGKTTTVEILEGFRTRTGGEVAVLGVDPARATRAWRAQVGVVLQSSGSSDDVTVHEACALQGAYYRHPRPVEEVLELVGLTDQRRQRIASLSGGQQRRLDVGKGIIGRPEVLFLDEPTTGFDPEARRQFWSLIRSLNSDGTTIVLTTHYLDEAEVLSHRLGILVDGRLAAEGAPNSIGGRERDRSTVSWTENGTPHALETDNPTQVVVQLADRLGQIPDLLVRRRTLEQVYLDLIGAAV